MPVDRLDLHGYWEWRCYRCDFHCSTKSAAEFHIQEHEDARPHYPDHEDPFGPGTLFEYNERRGYGPGI